MAIDVLVFVVGPMLCLAVPALLFWMFLLACKWKIRYLSSRREDDEAWKRLGEIQKPKDVADDQPPDSAR